MHKTFPNIKSSHDREWKGYELYCSSRRASFKNHQNNCGHRNRICSLLFYIWWTLQVYHHTDPGKLDRRRFPDHSQASGRIFYLFEDIVKAHQQDYKIALDLQKIEGEFHLHFLFRKVRLGDINLYALLIGEEMAKLAEILEDFHTILKKFEGFS